MYLYDGNDRILFLKIRSDLYALDSIISGISSPYKRNPIVRPLWPITFHTRVLQCLVARHHEHQTKRHETITARLNKPIKFRKNLGSTFGSGSSNSSSSSSSSRLFNISVIISILRRVAKKTSNNARISTNTFKERSSL